MTSNPARPRRFAIHQGFTLVELLVVISVVAMLVAMLLPALGKAKQTTHAMLCASNLHQIALAVSMYREDMKQYFAPLYASHTDGYGTYARAFNFRLRPYLGGLVKTAAGGLNSASSTDVNGRHLFYCPAATFYTFSDYGAHAGALQQDAWLYGTWWDTTIATYSQLSSLGYQDTNTTDWLKPKRFLAYPDQTLVMMDGANEPRVDHSYWPQTQRLRHHSRTTANLLMGDMHLENADKSAMDARWAQRVFHLYDPNAYRYAR